MFIGLDNMSVIATGKILDLVMLTVIVCLAYYAIRSVQRGANVQVRNLPGLDAIKEALGRATEMGSSVMMVPGVAAISGASYAADQIAGFSVLSYVAKNAAKLEIPLIVPIASYINLPFAEDAVKSAFQSEGKLETYKDEYVTYVAAGQFAFGAAVIGLLSRNKVAANIMVGYFWTESAVLAEAGATVGAIQLGGTSNTSQIPYFVAICDYILIGEEVFAAGAYLSKEPQQLGSLRGGDIIKFIVFGMMGLTMLLLLVGYTDILNLYKW